MTAILQPENATLAAVAAAPPPHTPCELYALIQGSEIQGSGQHELAGDVGGVFVNLAEVWWGDYGMMRPDGMGGSEEYASYSISPDEAANNARRLAACWNACAGIPTDVLVSKSGDATPVFALLMEARLQRDELLALVKRYLNETPLGHQPHMIAHVAEAVIAKCEART